MQGHYAFIDESRKFHEVLGWIKYNCCLIVPKKQFINLGLFLQNCWFYESDEEIKQDLKKMHENQSINSKINPSQNKSIHFTKLDNKDEHKTKVAERWIRYFMGQYGYIPSELGIKYNILGLVLNNIDRKYFDPSIKDDSQIYARFLRSQIDFLQKGLKEKEIIEKIIHDKTDNIEKQKDGYVYKYLLNQLSQISQNGPQIKVEFQEDSLKSILTHLNFNIDLEHSRNKVLNCYFLQLCDLLLGVHTHYVHEVQTYSVKSKLTNMMAPLIERLLKAPNNPNSRYKYKGAYHFSFFPKYKQFYIHTENFDGKIIRIRKMDLFFRDIKCKYPKSTKNDGGLNKFLLT
jgi:hypothetical protein